MYRLKSHAVQRFSQKEIDKVLHAQAPPRFRSLVSRDTKKTQPALTKDQLEISHLKSEISRLKSELDTVRRKCDKLEKQVQHLKEQQFNYVNVRRK